MSSSALYSFAVFVVCVDSTQRVLMVRESRVDCRGRFYIPAGRGVVGEDPLQTAVRVTREKTGLEVEPVSVVGVEHHPPIGQYPGQLRVFVAARFVRGVLKMREDDFSMDASWVAHRELGQLRLRAEDILPWIDDVVMGHSGLAATHWRALGSG